MVRLVKFIVPTLLGIAGFLIMPSAHAKDIDNVCRDNYAQCLEQVTPMLQAVKPHSHRWFQLKLYQLNAHFLLQNLKQLDIETRHLLKLENLPLKLQFKCFVYQAKIATYFNKQEQVQYYTQQANSAVEILARNEQDPESLIDYANFQLYTGQYEMGYRLLQSLEKRFENHPNAEIKREIYTNLGNLASRVASPEKTLQYFKLAYENALLSEGESDQLLALYNVGRGHQRTGHDKQAISIFERVVKQAAKLNNESLVSLANYRIAQLSAKLGELEKAKAALGLVDATYLLQERAEFERLKSKLGSQLP